MAGIVNASVCTATAKGKKIAYLKKGAKPTSKLCDGLTIIISAEPLTDTCKKVPTRIDRFDLWREGAHAIYLGPQASDTSPRIETSTSYRGHRPWVIKPIARRKILINPQQHRRYRNDPKRPGQKQRAASLQQDQ